MIYANIFACEKFFRLTYKITIEIRPKFIWFIDVGWQIENATDQLHASLGIFLIKFIQKYSIIITKRKIYVEWGDKDIPRNSIKIVTEQELCCSKISYDGKIEREKNSKQTWEAHIF